MTRRKIDDEMIVAAKSGNLEALKASLAEGADVNVKDDHGYTPLHWAAAIGNGPMAKLLLDKGADVTAEDKDGYTPLHRAAQNGHESMANLLLDKNTEWLQVEAQIGRRAVVELLARRRASHSKQQR